VGVARAWRLTREQYDNTVRELLGTSARPASARLPPEFSTNGFLNNADVLFVRETEAVQLNIIAQELAKETVEDRLGRVFPCDAGMLGDAACKDQFVRSFGKRAFRRELSDAEVTRYLALYNAGEQKQDGALGARAVIEAMLQSPNFLFRTEVGDGAAKPGSKFRLSAFEMATALSYYFLNGPPDEALLAAADAGELGSAAGVEKQARRLMSLPEARPAVVEALKQVFDYAFLADAKKDDSLFPEFAAAHADMAEEAARFTEHVVFESTGSFEELLTAPYTFLSPTLAPIYGLPAPASPFDKTPLSETQRAGMLTMPGLMSTLAVDNRTSPVARGKFVRERLLCEHIPDPLPDIDLTVPPLEPGLTGRDLLAAKTSGATCSACHSVMNPVGFGFENLDAIGRHRSEENGQPIDSSGELVKTRDADGTFQGPAELAQRLAASEQVRECMAIQAFRYGFGRAENQGDACAVAELHQRFRDANYDLKELAVQVALSESFAFRRLP
jgi:hypothetical protein